MVTLVALLVGAFPVATITQIFFFFPSSNRHGRDWTESGNIIDQPKLVKHPLKTSLGLLDNLGPWSALSVQGLLGGHLEGRKVHGFRKVVTLNQMNTILPNPI